MDLSCPMTPPIMLPKIVIAQAPRHNPSCDFLAQKATCPKVTVVGLDAEPENQSSRSGSGPLSLHDTGQVLNSLASISCFCKGEACLACYVIK